MEWEMPPSISAIDGSDLNRTMDTLDLFARMFDLSRPCRDEQPDRSICTRSSAASPGSFLIHSFQCVYQKGLREPNDFTFLMNKNVYGGGRFSYFHASDNYVSYAIDQISDLVVSCSRLLLCNAIV